MYARSFSFTTTRTKCKMLLELGIGLVVLAVLVVWFVPRVPHYDKNDIYENLDVSNEIDLDTIERQANTGDVISYADGNPDSIFIRFVLKGNTNHIALLVRRSCGDLYVWHVTTYKKMGVFFEPFAEFRKRISSKKKRTTVYWKYRTKYDLNQYFRHLLRPYIETFEGLPWAGKFGTRGIFKVLGFNAQDIIVTEDDHQKTPFTFNGITCSALVEFALNVLGILEKTIKGVLPDDIIDQMKDKYDSFNVKDSK